MTELQQQAEAMATALYAKFEPLNPYWHRGEKAKCIEQWTALFVEHLAPLEAQLVEAKAFNDKRYEELMHKKFFFQPHPDDPKKCNCAYCAKDFEAIAEHAAYMEMDIHSVEQQRDEARREVERLNQQQQRLFDLVRQQRGELHESGLINDQEYADLAGAKGSVQRLETYDQLTSDNQQLRARVAELEKALVKSKDAMFQYNSGCYPLPYPPEVAWKREAMDAVTNALGDKPSDSLLRQQELERKAKALEWFNERALACYYGYNEQGFWIQAKDRTVLAQRCKTLLEAIEAAMKGQQ